MKCSEFLYEAEITPNLDPLYDQFLGIVGSMKGIQKNHENRCFNYFKKAKRIVEKIQEVRKNFQTDNSIKKFLNLHEDLDMQGLIQSTLVALAGGIGKDQVRYAYIIGSKKLPSLVARTNGIKYEVEDPGIRNSLKFQSRPQFNSRISDIRVDYNTCAKNILTVYVKLKYPLSDREKIYMRYTLGAFKALRDDVLTTANIRFDQMIRMDNGEFVARFELDNDLNEKEAHSFYFQLENEKGVRLSKEYKILLKKVTPLLQLLKGFKSRIEI